MRLTHHTSPLYLFCVACKHGTQRQDHFGYGERWAPPTIASVVQDVQADVPIAVNVRVDGSLWDKDHLGGFKRVVFCKPNRHSALRVLGVKGVM